MNRSVLRRTRAAAAVLGAVALGVLAGCSSSSSTTTTPTTPTTPTTTPASTASSPVAPATSASATSTAVTTSSCGTNPGVTATGTPINLGTIVTDQSGTSFTDISNMAQAYFTCVNDNGGISGHPIKYYIETEQSSASQIASEASQLVTSDHVVGVVGNTSIIECSVDDTYWQKLGYAVIASGIAPECYSTPNYADVNMGPRYSSDGAVQYALTLKPDKIVFDQSNVPGTTYISDGVNAVAKAAGVPITDLATNVPISDADSVALQLVDDAGKNGAVVLNFTPPDALVILQAAQKLNIEDNVKFWGCSTPCNTDFLATSLGAKWDGHFFVNSELAPPDVETTPAMNLYKAILAQYGKAVSGGIGAFSEMGFVEARLMVQALESITSGTYTVATVNAAVKALKNVDTGMLCQAWTYGDYSMHIANNEDYTVTPENGKMVLAPNGGCTQITSVDPQIKQYRALAGTAPLDPTSS